MLAGLLAFKPQHAILIWAAMGFCLGWRALAGIASSGIVLFLLTIYTMPGCIPDFLQKVPPIVSSLQTTANYNWGRQVTCHSFWATANPARSSGADLAKSDSRIAHLQRRGGHRNSGGDLALRPYKSADHLAGSYHRGGHRLRAADHAVLHGLRFWCFW